MTMFNRLIYCRYATLMAIVLVSSCSLPKYTPPQADALPASYRDATDLQADTSQSVARLPYADFFKDSALVQLIAKALQHNYDLRSAVKQIESASLAFQQTKWNNVPRIGANAAMATITRPSDNSINGIMASQFLDQKYIGDYTSSFSISWEADVWGKLKGVKEDVLTSYLQTQEAARAIQTRLVASIAQGYYQLLMLDKQLAVTHANLLFADSTLVILQKQQELGLTTSLAVQQQEMLRDQLRKRIPALQTAVTLQENALSVLTGDLPGVIHRDPTITGLPASADSLSAGMPSALLANRPDVRSAELDFRKSLAGIHVAKVSMYPGINITAQGGLNSFSASKWFNVPGSLFGLVAGAVVQPVLQNKQLQTRYAQAKIASLETELRFKHTVLKAVGEVSDVLVRLNKLKEQEQLAEQLVTQAGEVIQQSLLLYRFNEITYLDVIIAQSNKLQAELELAFIQTERLNAATELYRSVGGGWLL